MICEGNFGSVFGGIELLLLRSQPSFALINFHKETDRMAIDKIIK